VSAAQPTRAELGYPSAAVAWYTVIVMMLLYVCSYTDRAVLSMLITPIQKDMHVNDFQISLLIGPVFGIVYTVLGVIAGWLTDRINRRNLLAAGSGLWGLATAFSGLAMTYGQLAVARLSIGVGEATLTPVAHSLIAEQFPPRRLSLAISVYSLGVTFGSGLALAFSGLIIDAADDLIHAAPFFARFQPWQLVFLVVAAPTLIMTPLIYTVRDGRKGPAKKAYASSQSGMEYLRSHARLLIPYFLGYGFTGIAGAAIGSFIPVYMSRHFDLTMSQIGIGYGLTIFLCTGAGQILGSIFVDFLYERGIKDIHTRIHMYSWLISAPAVLLAFMTDNSLFFLLLIGVYYFCTFPFQGYSNAGLQLITPPQFRGRMSAAFLAFLQLLGMVIGPPAVGFLTDFVFKDPKMIGWSIAVVSLACVPGAVILLWVAAREKRRFVAPEGLEAP
jgi:MFS family permease